jgi:hypothetical protein
VSALSQLRQWQSLLDSAFSSEDKSELIDMINGALAVAPPGGSPPAISDKGGAYQKASSTCLTVSTDLGNIATGALPAAWRGDVADTASQAVTALSAEASNASGALLLAGQTLLTWAESLQKAQRDDRYGRGCLQSARSSLLSTGEFSFDAVMTDARAGIAAMAAAASAAEAAGDAAAATLNQLAGQATAEHLHASGLDALDAVVLANQQTETLDDSTDILTAAEMTRASQLMSSMSAAQLQEFETLLAGAESPAEAAYLMKALAAGNSLPAIKQFDALIHPYGNDPAWLAQHLSPDMGSGSGSDSASYDGTSEFFWPSAKGDYATLSQGNIGDCVAAANVVALANLDPVFMLKLTTGNQPGVSGSDSVPSFVHRLQGAFISQFQAGQRADGHSQVFPAFTGGLGDAGGNLVANSTVGAATGASYQMKHLGGSSDNQAVLPRIEQAVDSGQPVPMGVTNASGSNHEVVIIGANGGQFEIYDPAAGITNSVSVQQFVSNQMTGVSWNQPIAGNVELPST